MGWQIGQASGGGEKVYHVININIAAFIQEQLNHCHHTTIISGPEKGCSINLFKKEL